MKFIKPVHSLFIIFAAVLGSPALLLAQDMRHAILDSNAIVKPFAPGVVSTQYDEGATSFSPDNKTVYFTAGAVYSTICLSKNVNGKWVKPEVAAFSGKWIDMDAFVSPDGKKLVFASYRPVPGSVTRSQHADLWYCDKTGKDAWSEPHHLDTIINNGADCYAPSISGNGTLYWCSPNREKGRGMQGYYAVWSGGHYDTPKTLAISGVNHVQDPFIAPNSKYLVFLSGKDIYVSMRQGENWLPAQKLGKPVSMGDYVGSPYVSHDGKTLYFTTARRKGFYERDLNAAPLNFDGLLKENDGIFNGAGNILMVPVNLPDGN